MVCVVRSDLSEAEIINLLSSTPKETRGTLNLGMLNTMRY